MRNRNIIGWLWLGLVIGLLAAAPAHAFYNPQQGRWLNRDPIAERGGVNIFVFVGNNAINHFDQLGLDEGCTGPTSACKLGDPLSFCSAGLPAPPKPGDKDRMHPLPEWFKNPPDEGKPCCCSPPAKLAKFQRTGPMPTKGKVDSTGQAWTINMSVDIQFEGCYKDLAIFWWTCIREGNQDSGMVSWCINSTSCSFTTHSYWSGAGPYLTNVRLRYLSCEGGKWVKKMLIGAGLTYTWEKGGWIQNFPDQTHKP